VASCVAITSAWKTLQWSGRGNETFMSSSGEKTPPTCLGVKLGAVRVYVDGVYELMWEVVPVCTGGNIDLVFSFEVDYGWDVVCITW